MADFDFEGLIGLIITIPILLVFLVVVLSAFQNIGGKQDEINALNNQISDLKFDISSKEIKLSEFRAKIA
jgi:Tfp pilus assembly protein PilO